MPSYIKSTTFDIETGEVLSTERVTYCGMWEECKKGRETQGQIATTNAANQQQQYGAIQPEISQLDVGPGGLSNASSARLASDMRNISDTYNSARQSGLQRIAQHGMGTLTGENSSLNNTLARGQAGDELSAYENAQQMTRQDELAALNARMGLEQSTGDLASNAAYRQSQMGSTLGDIGAGLAGAAGVAGGLMTGLGNLGWKPLS